MGGLVDSGETVLAYARRGWPVFPLHAPTAGGGCDCGKSECDRPAKHPRTSHGFYDATTNEESIGRWRDQWPDANWGIRTGTDSRLVVLDVDGDKGFQAVRGLLLPITHVILSGRGWHAYFTHPDGSPWPTATGILPGVDLLADKHYVIAPPSRHVSGRVYEFYCDAPLCPPPSWLVELMAQSAPTVPLADRPDSFPVGQRNDQLFRRGCGFVRNPRMSPTRLLAWLRAVNRNRCIPQLEEAEVERIARNIWKKVHGPRLGGEARKHGLP